MWKYGNLLADRTEKMPDRATIVKEGGN